jgi:hypothetical protein
MAMSMRERIARAIDAGRDMSKVFGLFDYSQGRREKPFVVRDYRLQENQTIFETDDMDLAREKYDEAVSGFRADLVLAELETPTDGMVDTILGGLFVPLNNITRDAARAAWSAAIRAARERK